MIKEKLKRINNKYYPEKIFFDPEWLVLGVNNVCNLHCKMCDVGLSDNDTNFAVNLTGTKPLNMPFELTERIINECAEQYPNTKIGFAFTEPLVYPHLIDSIKLASAKGLFTSITTNALTLKQKAAELAQAGLNEICISLDGPEAIHNEIRGHKKSFQNAIEGILELQKQEKKVVIKIFCVITEWNIGHLKEFCDFFKNKGIKQIGFMHTNFTDQKTADHHNTLYGKIYPATHSNVGEINIDKMDLEKLNEELNAIRTEHYDFEVSSSPDLTYISALKDFYLKPEKILGTQCNDVYRNIMIKSDGSVIPAHGRCYNLTLGNLNDHSLSEIWGSSVLSQFRKDLMKAGGLFPACSRCCSAF